MRVGGFAGVGVAALALVAFVGCSGGDTSGPGTEEETTTQVVDVQNVFAQEQAGGAAISEGPGGVGDASRLSGAVTTSQVEIRRIRLTVYEVPGNAVLFQKVYEVDPTKTRWTLEFEAPVGATVRLVSELMSVTAGVEKVEFSGQAGPLTITDCEPNCTPIPVKSYPGPVQNLEATSVAVTPAADTIAVNATTQLTATVAPAGPAYQPVWTSLDTAVASVSSSGLVTGRKDGFARIIAAVGQRRDTAFLVVGQATCTVGTVSPGAAVSGFWDGTDCIVEDFLVDRYAFSMTAPTALTTTLTTGVASRTSGIYAANGTEILDFIRTTPGDMTINYFLEPGSYELRVGAPVATPAGSAYAAATSIAPAQIGCASNASSGNFTFSGQTLGGSDCVFDNRFEDRVLVRAEAGRDITISMTSGFSGAVMVRQTSMTPGTYFTRVESPVTGGTATATWRAATTGYYQLIFSSRNAGSNGTYSGSISVQ